MTETKSLEKTNERLEKNTQKPWFMSNVWQQMVTRPKQIQKDVVFKPEEVEHSQINGLILSVAAAGASLIVLFIIIMTMCFFKKKKAVVGDVIGPSIVVYPSTQGSCPQFLTKDILFSLPPLKHSNSLGDLFDEENDSDTTGEPLVPAGRRHSQRSHSFSCYGLGVIDPALYRSCSIDLEEELNFPEDHIGRLWFSVRYETTTEKLLVSILKAKNLPSRTLGAVNGCDPFVRLHLLPDERRYQQSKMKKKTCNPFFDETFVFQVPAKDLYDHLLKLTVIDSGRAKRRAVIGHVSLPLKEFATETEQKLFKMDLEKEVQENVSSNSGELLISLLYNETLNRLSVTVVEGRKIKFSIINEANSFFLTCPDNYVVLFEGVGSYYGRTHYDVTKFLLESFVSRELIKSIEKIILEQMRLMYWEVLANVRVRVGIIKWVDERNNFKDPEKHDSYVKVTLNQNYRSVKAKKTGTVRGTENPSFFECFNFRLSPDASDVSSLSFETFQSVSGYGRDKLIGKFILGSHMFARGKGKTHWESAFSNPKEAFQQWHILSG